MKAETNRGMLALVILMGAVIVIGLIVVVVTIASRLIDAARTDDSGIAAPSFEVVDIPISDGCQVVETVSDGDRLILRLGAGARCDQLLIIDIRTGELAGRINLVPAP